MCEDWESTFTVKCDEGVVEVDVETEGRRFEDDGVDLGGDEEGAKAEAGLEGEGEADRERNRGLRQ